MHGGILANDSDADGDFLTTILVSGPSHGTLTLGRDGSLVYTPNTNFSGTDSFTYRVTDGTLKSEVATVTITVNPVNDAPVGIADSYETSQDATLNVPIEEGLLSNDSALNRDALTAALITGPS